MLDRSHLEKNFEDHVVLELRRQGWLVGTSSGYDVQRALYAEDVIAWVKTTQKDKWEYLEQSNGEKAGDVLLDRLNKALWQNGSVHILRKGISIAGCGSIILSEAAPEDDRNATVTRNYAANILRVVPQLQYHQARRLAIDLVLFINGIPVATVEVKTDFTQSADAAVEQYRRDRLPVDPQLKTPEPLLTFKRGAVVHFAMSESEIQMATRLEGEKTLFLPFNQGNAGRAGNPARQDGEYPVAYFWKEVCQRDAWLRIFHSFVFTERKESTNASGRIERKENLIFPRYHQWSAVNLMIADARKNGAGLTYLADHSAGSGKTSTISWLSYDLIKLRNHNGEALFNSVIIVTDRTVLDSQLQDAVRQIDSQRGVVAAIGREASSVPKSAQLSEALLSGTPIIVVTIQTFPFAMEAIVTDQRLANRSFAVIIDEAHASQTGSTAAKLQTALAMSGQGSLAELDVEQLLEKLQSSRVRPRNVSYFAFTGTPKHSTLTLFGRPRDPAKPLSKDNPPVAFHRYSMRQAIEEGFILDVLKGYTSYRTAYNLAKKADDTRRVSTKAAKRALAQWMSLHPTNVSQKVQFIIEHFTRNVSGRLNGQSKAMVVTSSRAAAVRYKKGFDGYVARHPQYKSIRSLIAFSGKVSGKEAMHAGDAAASEALFTISESDEFTEEIMNSAVSGQDLRLAFDKPEYRVMLVADKFQTGFDQPKLVALYVDKKIANEVEIVQTFSRLNRMAAGKDQVYIVDFVNDPESVRRAFSMYDDGAVLEEIQDPNVVYDIKERLDEQDIYDAADLQKFKETYFSETFHFNEAGPAKHRAVYKALERATTRYEQSLLALRKEAETLENRFHQASTAGSQAVMDNVDQLRKDVEERISNLLSFKGDLARFCNTYAYIAQLIEFNDPELENFAAFAKLLQKLLKGEPPENIDLSGLVLSGYEIKKDDDGAEATPEPASLRPMSGEKAGVASDTPRFLIEIIAKLNSLFGDAAPLRDQALFVNHIAAIARESDLVTAQVNNNDRENAMKGNLPGAVHHGVARAFTSHQRLAAMVLKPDRQALNALTDIVYDLLRNNERLDVERL